jgi:3-isopropylmalate/(R)-2-methylmalate dehydratase large subunit
VSKPKTLFEKIWHNHVIRQFGGDRFLIHVDRHLVNEATSRFAFEGLKQRGRAPKCREATFGVIDHDLSTRPGRRWDSYEPAKERISAMQENCRAAGIELIDIHDSRQGIVHVIAPEMGLTLPGSTIACGDSHTATSGGLGAWAWGVGTTEIERLLATQSLIVRKPKTMRVTFTGTRHPGISAKDLILYFIGQHGVTVGTGHAVEYAGPAIRALPVEGRFTICNMSIEFGARSGLIAPDDAAIQYLAGRAYAPKGAMWDLAVADWRGLPSDEDAQFDRELEIDCAAIRPQVTWGTSPQDVIAIDEPIPAPDGAAFDRREPMARSLDYMGLQPGMVLEGLPIDFAFIGSCTNSRLSDLEIAAAIVRGRKVPEGVTAIVVPGSTSVKRAAESAGLDKVFTEAGFEWRESGCSMCQTLGGDMVPPGKRSISTTNRNFENRQGAKARTHLASPAMVAAAAVSGCITDVRKLDISKPGI